jgi:decaprenylphospho-beta-D-ribofuranose 2-oxidase
VQSKPKIPFAMTQLVSFDGAESTRCPLYCPDRYRNLENIFAESGAFAVRGAGLSYANLSFGAGSSAIAMTHFNRFLNFDEATGLIEVEAGMTLGELAQWSVPRGWYLTVQPGHPSITIGGCLAADVHGKNQFQDLNFKEQVQYIRLFHPDHGLIFCDRNSNMELFDLTCGGFGLTGVVLSVGIKLGKLKASGVETKTIPVEDIFQLPSLLKEHSSKFDLLYSWHEFNTPKKWGHGFLKAGRQQSIEDSGESLGALAKGKPLLAEGRGRHLPISLLFPRSVWLMNLAYSRKELLAGDKSIQPLVDFLFPVLNKTVYFDLFGKSGFHETQVLIPFDKFEPVMKELRAGLRRFPTPVTLASCKLFSGKQELLRFIGEGVVLAMNFPRNESSLRLLNWWDRIVMEARGLPNLSKDSRLSAEVVQHCYPQYEVFLGRLKKWDSRRVFQTSLSKRLCL